MLGQLLASGKINKDEAIRLFEEYSHWLTSEYNVSDVSDEVITEFIDEVEETCYNC